MREFEAVYRAYFMDVYRYALKLAGEKALAEDLTQDTFLRALDAISGGTVKSSSQLWTPFTMSRCLFIQ